MQENEGLVGIDAASRRHLLGIARPNHANSEYSPLHFFFSRET